MSDRIDQLCHEMILDYRRKKRRNDRIRAVLFAAFWVVALAATAVCGMVALGRIGQ